MPPTRSASPLARVLLLLPLLVYPARASGQILPAGPIHALDGRLVVSGEVVGTVGEADEAAYFNYTDYEHNALRLIRLGASAVWRPVDRLAFVGELRSEDFHDVTPFAAYVRFRPWPSRRLDFQAGRIPPAFGAFGRRAYGTGNPMIGYPLAYQYLTSLRTDAVPVTAEDLFRMRARGWRASYPVGSAEPAPGIPLVSAFRFDTGVQVRWAARRIDVTGALTNGTLSNPRVSDDNNGKQLSGRVAINPAVGLVIGASGARGAWLSRSVPIPAPASRFKQTSAGLDAEYSRDHWLVRGEAVWTRWQVPYAGAAPDGGSLGAWGAWLEGQYRIAPRVLLSARADHLDFSTIWRPEPGTAPFAWDAPVTRIEGALAYYLQRNVVVRFGLQTNWRESGRIRTRTYPALQMGWWF
jgi:hypothetical protein